MLIFISEQHLFSSWLRILGIQLCPFFMRLMYSVSGDIRFARSYLLASFGHVQNFERTPRDKYVRLMNVNRAYAVCLVLVR